MSDPSDPGAPMDWSRPLDLRPAGPAPRAPRQPKQRQQPQYRPVPLPTRVPRRRHHFRRVAGVLAAGGIVVAVGLAGIRGLPDLSTPPSANPPAVTTTTTSGQPAPPTTSGGPVIVPGAGALRISSEGMTYTAQGAASGTEQVTAAIDNPSNRPVRASIHVSIQELGRAAMTSVGGPDGSVCNLADGGTTALCRIPAASTVHVGFNFPVPSAGAVPASAVIDETVGL